MLIKKHVSSTYRTIFR